MRLTERITVFPQPEPNVSPYECVSYTRASGVEMMRIRFLDISDDIFDHFSVSYSPDNGRTWSEPQSWPSTRDTGDGLLRRLMHPGFVDPHTGRLMLLIDEALFRRDNSLEGMTQYYPLYVISDDGGQSWSAEERIVQQGAEYSPDHPFTDVWIGKNCLMIATNACVALPDGKLLFTAQMAPLGADGALFLPAGAFTYTEALLLIASWRDDGRLQWETSRRVAIPPELSLRGAIEPTITAMPDGRILMVLRGSNSGDQPGYKWYCVSEDHGVTWDTPRPWRYTDGQPFYSPSSFSELLRHSSGKYLWVGNICPDNPHGNLPRYPLLVGEVDPQSLLLIRDSLLTIDTRTEADSPGLQLSNFNLYEDRETGELVVRAPRWMPDSTTHSSDVYLYRIAVE